MVTITYYYYTNTEQFGEDVLNVGLYNIDLTVEGEIEYYSYIEESHTFEITPLGITIRADKEQSTIYNTQKQYINYSVFSGNEELSSDYLQQIFNDEVSIVVNYSGETINADSYSATIGLSNPTYKNIYITSDSVTTVDFVIEKLTVKISNTLLSMNYDSTNRTWALISPLLKDQLTLTLTDGSPIKYTEFDYTIRGMHNGVYKYGTVSGYTNLQTTTNVVGSTYLVTVDVAASVTKNYTIINNTVIFKYKTAKIGEEYFTIEDAIAEGGTIILEGLSSNTNYIMTCFTALDKSVSGYNSDDYYTLDSKLRVPFANVDMDFHGSGGKTQVTKPGLISGTDTSTDGCDSIAVTIEAYVYSVLMIPSNVELTIDSTGELIIGALLSSSSKVNNRGVVVNDGTITSYGKIGAYGYLKGKGKLILNSGTVIDVFNIFDWNGGATSAGMNNAKILPVSAYTCHNISCETKIFPSVTYEAFWTIEFSNRLYGGFQRGDKNGNVKIIGNGGLFSLTSGYIIKTANEGIKYNTRTELSSITGSNQIKGQKDVIKIYGTCTDNSISLKISASGTNFTMSSSTEMANAIGFIDVVIGNDNNNNIGNLTLSAASYKFYPGTNVTIDNGASLTVNKNVKLLFYTINDAIKDEASKPGKFITSSGGHCIDRYDSTITVNGTLTVNSGAYFGGTILTQGSTGKLELLGSAVCPIEYVTSVSDGTLTDDIKTSISNHDALLYAIRGNGSILTSAVDNSIYYAKNNAWYNEKVNIIFDANCGELTSNSVEIIENLATGTTGYLITKANLDSASAEREHYEFMGWYIDIDCTIPAEGQYIYTNTYLYAKWNEIFYDIKYEDVYYQNFATGESTNNSENIDSFSILTNFTLKDPLNGEYQFNGWYSDSACTNRITNISGEDLVDLLINKELTIYAQWYPADATTYTIIYHNDNTDISCPESFSFVLTDTGNWSSITLENLHSLDNNSQKPLYFNGWYLDLDDENSIITTLTENIFDENNTVNLYAKWEEKSFVYLNYNYNGNDMIVSYYYMPNVEKITLPTLMEYSTSKKETMVWFTLETLNSSTFYVGGVQYNPIESKTHLYGDYYYKVTTNDISSGTYTGPSDLTKVLLHKLNLSGLTLSMTYTNENKDTLAVTKSGAFYKKNFTHIILDQCTNIPDGKTETKTWTETVTSGCSSEQVPHYKFFYMGLFDSNNSIEQVIISGNDQLSKYMFSNCYNFAPKLIISSISSTLNKKDYYPTDSSSWSNSDVDSSQSESGNTTVKINKPIKKDDELLPVVLLIIIVSSMITSVIWFNKNKKYIINKKE